MSKGKIIVVSMMLFCVLCFVAVAFYFLGNNTQPTNQQQTAAILQVAGLTNSGKDDAQAMKALFDRRIITRQVNLDSGA
mgnify:CR=1 FL=1